MTRRIFIPLIAYEVIALALIYRLWTGKQRPGVVERYVLSIVLLIPFVGWIFYSFFGTSPGSHGDNPSDRWWGG